MVIVFNKVFTGGYLKNNLGHELKNFLVCDDGTRGIFITPHGRCSKKPDYVIHLIESSGNFKKQTFEIVGISKVSNKEISEQDYLNKKFKNKIINDIFEGGYGVNFREISLLCEQFYTPKEDKNIYICMGADKEKLIKHNDNEIFINISARFGQSEAMHTFCKNNDLIVVKIIFDNLKKFLTVNNDNLINYNDLKSELPLCIINDRVSLEDSMSNMIVYFLRRNNDLLKKFLLDFLNIKTKSNEKFQIIREEKNIDLLLKSDNKIIVIKNKINSGINGIKSPKYSQLSKYYQYVNINIKIMINYFFLLKPNNNYITTKYINSFHGGNKYIIKNYSDLYNVLKNHKFKCIDDYGKFIYDEFKTNVMYLTWTKAKQIQYTSFILLKQIVNSN